jgi:DNA polymerase III subunit epsilon
MLLPLPLDRPLVFIDLETTGLSFREDRIIELAIMTVSPQGDVVEKVRRFNPEMPIPAEASAVHGIYDDDLKDEAPFRARARNLFAQLDPCDLAGFNIRRFDVPMLVAEFKRAGIDFEWRTRRIIDVQAIFHREEPRDLSAAARFYLGREHQEAHTALGDIRTTAAVLSAQLERYEHVPNDMDGLNRYCDEAMPIRTELDSWFQEKDGGLVFRRGKHKGRTLVEVAENEPDYLDWMLGVDDMDEEVLEVVRGALSGPDQAPLAGSDPAL